MSGESISVQWVFANNTSSDTNYRNTKTQITVKQKYKLQKYNLKNNQNLNYRNTELQITSVLKYIIPIQKYKFWIKRNTNYKYTEIQITEIQKYKL